MLSACLNRGAAWPAARCRELDADARHLDNHSTPTMLLAFRSFLLLASCNALQLAISRRAVLTATPALLAPIATRALDDNKIGNCLAGGATEAECGYDKSAVARLLATPGSGEAAGIRIGGSYDDPQHPGCTRKIILQGSNAIVQGTDEPGGKKWQLKGEPYGKYLVIDFSPKGGPKQVIAKWNGVGLAFEDGNVWTKK